jgi:NDP-sugar pyrophosphorylase family protein
MWLENLEKHGIEEVLVNTRSREKIEVFSEKCTGWTKISVFHELEQLGNAGIILANRDWIAGTGPFLNLNGDHLIDVNLGRMVTFHCGHGLPFTL